MNTPYTSMQSLGAFYPTGHAPIMPPHPEVYQPAIFHDTGLSLNEHDGFVDYEGVDMSLPPAQSASRPRQRRRHHGPDHIKHKRTRSGCFTCRQRRVKCDEGRPVCERCRKGGRECLYPPPPTKDSRTQPKSKLPREDSESDSFDDDGPEQATMPSIAEDDIVDDSTAPPSSAPSHTPQAQSPSDAIVARIRSSGLPKDIRLYLRFYQEHMSDYHYAFKLDPEHFMQTSLIDIALQDPSRALLYAIVAFAAYHYTVANDNLILSPFLSYYNESIMSLQRSLNTRKANTTTLLTILQLATIEEFLGDWVNLLGHQKAAYQIMTNLFSPATIMQDATSRHILDWYIRFDLFAGLMAGGETKLSHEWFVACHDFYYQRSQKASGDAGALFQDFNTNSRLLANETTLLMAAKTQKSITDEDFVAKVEDLKARFAAFGHRLDTAFTDSSRFADPASNASSPLSDADDDDEEEEEEDASLFQWRDPHFLYGGKLFPMNHIFMDYWAMDLMLRYQTAIALGQQPGPEIVQVAMKKCKMFEAIHRHQAGVPFALLPCHASLGIASLFLPRTDRYTMWCRRKYVLVEQMGLIYPPTMRGRASLLWGDDVHDWWLPDGEGYPPTIRAIRDFIDYRARMPQDEMGAHVRDMSGIFRGLDIRDKSGAGDDDNVPAEAGAEAESAASEPALTDEVRAATAAAGGT